jgi:uncharacterized membrane protein
MSYQERRSLVSLISTLAITGAYTAYMLQRYPDAGAYSPEVFRFWGLFFIVLIPVSIIARVIIHILFSILNTIATQEAEPSITDERDRLIELKASRNALYAFSLGVVLAMGALVFEQPPSTMFILVTAAGVASEIIDSLSQFFFYRRGF